MNEIVIVDIETSHTNKKIGSIVEIGISKLNLGNGERKIIYDELVKEDSFGEKDRDAWIFKNTDMKFEDVMAAKPIDMGIIQSIFNKYRATAYNKNFDFGFLKDKGFIINELNCPMIGSTNIVKAPFKNNWRPPHIPKNQEYKWPSVQESWDFLFGKDTGYIEKHRGGDDSLREAKIVYEFYKKHGFDLGLGNPEVKES